MIIPFTWTPSCPTGTSTDFPKVNPLFNGQPYCFYYAVEWFHDQRHFGAMAVVKQGLCASPEQPRPQPLSLQPPVYWHQPGMIVTSPVALENTHAFLTHSLTLRLSASLVSGSMTSHQSLTSQ
jgi:hypothetical protein